MNNRYFEQPPLPSSLLFAVRSIGYTFEMAVADIIDNSISANASDIHIYSEVSPKPFFCFIDNGNGMNEDELKNAMLLGSLRLNSTASSLDLGRFGMGLKSASLSQCKKFTVVTKKDGKTRGVIFDIDVIERKQKWILERVVDDNFRNIPMFDKLNTLTSGTLVVWENFDKIEDSAKDFDVSFRKYIALAKAHVEFVFHRFYEKISIFFNEQRIEKRDPFLKDSYGRQQEGRALSIELNGATIMITPYTLPYSNSLSHEEKQLLGNPKSIYDEQGLYIYRNERLISWGSWFHTEVRNELNKLARVQVDIPASLDSIWMLDVKKSTAKIPDRIRESIRIAINDSTNRSRGTLRHPGEKEVGERYNVWQRFLAPDSINVSYKLNRDNPILKLLQSKLDSSSRPLLENFIHQIECFLPKTNIHHDECQDLRINEEYVKTTEQLAEELLEIIRVMSDDYHIREDLLNSFLKSQVYLSLSKQKEQLMKRLRYD